MHRQPARHSTSTAHPSFQDPGADENRWILRQLLLYAQRLVGFLELTPEAVSFFVELLPQKERWAIVEDLHIEVQQQMIPIDRTPSTEVAEVIDNWLNAKHAVYSVRKLRSVVTDAVSKRLLEVEDSQHEIQRPNGRRLFKEMDELVSLFNLSEAELSIVLFSYCYSVYKHVEELCDSIPTRNQLRFLAVCIGAQPHQTAMLLREHGNLRRYGIIQKLEVYRCWAFRLSDKVEEYLSGGSGRKFAELFCELYIGQCYDLNTYDVPADYRNILCALVRDKKPHQLLLYGEPGTGKTEYAKSLIRHSAKDTWIFDRSEESRASTVLSSVAAAGRAICAENGVLIVDEADWMLNSGYSFFGNQQSPEKGAVNTLLDDVDTSIVWIVNDVSLINSSTLRRFAFSCHFKKPSTKRKKHLLTHYLREKGMSECLSADEVDELARYRVNPANISDAVEVSSCLQTAGNNPSSLIDTFSIVFGEKERLQCGTRQTRRHQVEPHFDVSILNTSHKPADICSALECFSNTAGGAVAAGCASMLFWGAPGTGKTAFAKYLAETLMLELMEKRASDLVSMWVGQTEKNIRQAFEEASEAGAILILDEADSFLSRRDKATVHYLITETNELLKQMETFEGILICCTNLLENLDRASLRRFVWKVEFGETLPENRVKLVRAYFPGVRLPEAEAGQLKSIEDITPGDIAVLHNRYRLMGMSEPGADKLCLDIRAEVDYRRYGSDRGIGFL